MKNRPNDQARTVKSNNNHPTKLTSLKHGQVVTDSQTMAKHLDVRHAKFIEVLQSLFEDYPDLRDSSIFNTRKKGVLSKDTFVPRFIAYQTINRGQSFTAYLINEAGFYLLLPRFKTEKAKQAYREFVESFQKMKSHLLQAEVNKHNLLFQKLRDEGKESRRSFTDELKDFAAYSKGKGSKGYPHYYSNFTRWIYTALDIEVTDSPKVRDSLRIEQVEALDRLENDIAILINEGMSAGLHYKQIKDDAKALILKG